MQLKLIPFIVLALLLGPFSRSSRADDGWDGHILSLIWENDATTGTDKHYTQGAGISYLSADDAVPGWVKEVSSVILAFGYKVGGLKYGVGIHQEIYTHEGLQNPDLVAN